MITEHGLALDANFSKFGYSAHLRTKDDDSSENSVSGDRSESGSIDFTKRDNAPVLKFWRRPVVRQYFHKGLLWRSSRSGEVASFELFSDLLFVGIIGIVGDTASQNPTNMGLLHFFITFVLSWKMWLDLTASVNSFEIDDVFQRICVMVYLICVLGLATNLVYAFDTTYTSMIAFHVAERIFQAVQCAQVAYLLPTVRAPMLGMGVLIVSTSALWIGSIHVPWPHQLALIFVAIFFDLFGYFIMITAMRWTQHMTSKYGSERLCGFARRMEKYFEFFPAVNIEHRTERTNAFVTLVFGSSVLAVLYQNNDPSATASAFFGKACLALIQTFAFNTMYFEFDAANLHVHAIRRHWVASLVWIAGHMPFVMGYVLSAATMSKLVLAHDCSNANVESLGDQYRDESLGEISSARRWFFCGGLACALASMSLISMCHIHKTIPHARLRKRPRLLIRSCLALIICLLPLAPHRALSSLTLMSITSALVMLALGVDMYGNSCPGDGFWLSGFCDEEKKKCNYRATCPLDRKRQRDLDKKIKRGDKILIADLLSHSPDQGSSIGGTTDSSTRNSSTEALTKATRPRPYHMHSYV